MRQIPVISELVNYLTVPGMPPSSLSISETHLAMITLRRSGGEFEPRNLGVVRLPEGLVRGSFDELNISDESSMLEYLEKTAEQAGMGNVRTLSATLPAGAGRSFVITLDSVPKSSAELDQMLEWKIERTAGRRIQDLRVSYVKLPNQVGDRQWMASVASEHVVAQYEDLFSRLGWTVGLIVPQHLGEAQWLMRMGTDDDQVVVSTRKDGFNAVIVRNGSPILIREVICSPEERDDEIFRLMVFYRDRLVPSGSANPMRRVLVIGDPTEQRSIRELISTALETSVSSLDPLQLGLRVESQAPFNHFAAAGGLATMAWG